MRKNDSSLRRDRGPCGPGSPRKAGNLDSFFTDGETVRYLLAKESEGADIAVLEGAMGYYDGLGGNTGKGSASEIAEITGLRPGSVRSKLSRSLARMRRYLESERRTDTVSRWRILLCSDPGRLYICDNGVSI